MKKSTQRFLLMNLRYPSLYTAVSIAYVGMIRNVPLPPWKVLASFIGYVFIIFIVAYLLRNGKGAKDDSYS